MKINITMMFIIAGIIFILVLIMVVFGSADSFSEWVFSFLKKAHLMITT
ncbi:MAG: hypothetical protein WC376_04420 [Candidatus Nanoarchaeia archaeon]